ncbi:MAG TPA: hypothetical protein PL045_09260, partial [Chitinophagaceae bacterium]|nr:hypothetical protein [Chitinophagaceae bacterium]
RIESLPHRNMKVLAKIAGTFYFANLSYILKDVPPEADRIPPSPQYESPCKNCRDFLFMLIHIQQYKSATQRPEASGDAMKYKSREQKNSSRPYYLQNIFLRFKNNIRLR